MLRAASIERSEADLIASGTLTMFSRPWRSPYRGRLAIHAKSAPDTPAAIVAVATLVDVIEFGVVLWALDERLEGRRVVNKNLSTLPISERDKLLAVEGTIGRWLYVLGDVAAVNPQVECTGKGGGIWTVPDPVEQACGPLASNVG